MNGPARRILYLWGNVDGVGGTERRMAEVASELAARGHSVHSHARSINGDSRLQQLMRASGASTTASRSWLGARRAWTEFSPDTVIAFGLKPSLAARAFRVLGARADRLFMARNGLDFLWKPWMHYGDRLTCGLIDLYIANSTRVGDHLVQRGIPASQVRVVGSAVGKEWLAPTIARSGPRVVAMVGNNRPEKNQLFGVDAFLASRTDALLRIYTDDGDSLRTRLEGSENPRAALVEIVENRTISPQDLDRVDVLLHPSLSESLPRIVLEARSRGCRVVASDAGDTRLHIAASEGDVVLREWNLAGYAAALDAALALPTAWRRHRPEQHPHNRRVCG
jgi:glycosyltransferase involved in cell wall biosynthesis